MPKPPGPSGRRPTMQDVADRVGLSRQLVSIVMRGTEGASAESRQRVLDAAEEIGYYPDESAQLLRRRNSGRFGVLYSMRQPFDVDLVDALYSATDEAGISLVLSTLGPGRAQPVALNELMRQRIEALIIITSGNPTGAISGLPSGIPSLLLGGPRSDDGHDAVEVDNDTGVSLAVDHLVGLGHERIAYVGPEHGPNAPERLAGYRQAMQRHRLAIDPIDSDFTEAAGSAAAEELMRRPRLPTAVACGNDRCAIGLLTTLVRHGTRVPEDLSVVGFDDSSVAALPAFDLTSVRPSAEEMARQAVSTILERLNDPDVPPRRTTITPSLTIRGSTGTTGR